MRLIFVTIVTSLVALLTGCNPNELPEAIAKNNAAIEAAKQVKDPWEARKQLEAQETVARKARDNICISDDTCPSLTGSINKVMEEEDRYLKLAATDMNPIAIDELFNKRDVSTDKEVKLAIASKLLGIVADTNDPRLLLAAAKIVGDGINAVRDTTQATAYLARAWALGASTAAGDAAVQFDSINDTRNAYLWSLRCTEGCNRASSVQLQVLEEHLSPEAAKQAQEAAADRTVVELDTNS